MLTITARRGLFALVLTAIGIIAALLAGARASSALGLQATWTMTGRADATLFRPGPQPSASGRLGFEVISFAAAGPSAALDSYVYAGLDAAPGSGAPTRPFVTCDASAAAGMLTLNVGNAFPYAGCVYFPRAANTGDRPIEVDLGALTHPAGVFCGQTTCKVDIVVGGLDEAGLTRRCAFEGTVARSNAATLTYRLEPGAAVTCPVFVVLLQPAAEATTYSITIDPPRPRDPTSEVVQVAGATPVSRPPGPATGSVAGATPQPPRTGFGLVTEAEEARPGDGTAVLALASFAALLGAALLVGLPGRRRDDDPKSTPSRGMGG